MILSIYLVSMEYFNLQDGILKEYTQENGFYELGSGFFLFFFGIYLLFIGREFVSKRISYLIYVVGLIFILGALEELSWGQHLLGFESVEYFSQNNKQHEMNMHNFIPASFFGLFVNVSFYTFFVFIPIFIYFYKEKILNSKYRKYGVYLEYVPSPEIVLVFCFGFAMQKYFIFNTSGDTFALILALVLSAFIAKRKNDILFSLHLVLLVCITVFFMFAHEIFSYKNLQYEIREFVLIYTMLFWIFTNIKLLKRDQNKGLT